MKRGQPDDVSSVHQRRLSADLEELAMPENSGLLAKRQKLDGKPFDLKITRLEMIAQNTSSKGRAATNI